MARQPRYAYSRSYSYEDEDHIDMRPLLRLGVWGFSAIIAIGVAVLAGRSEVGTARATAALAALRTSPMELLNPGAAQASKTEAELKALSDTVMILTADRDRLAARLATLEHSLTDLTGSIAGQRAGAVSSNLAAPGGDQADASSPAALPANALPPAAPPNGPSSDEARAPDPAATVGTIVSVPQRSGPLSTIQSYVSAASASQSAPPTRMAEAPADANAADEPKGIAVELAIATNVNALRARWGTLKIQHPALLEGLKPLVAVRPSARPGGFTEFHLVAGPVPDSAVAGRLCGALSAAHVPCRPAPYDGQSLELR